MVFRLGDRGYPAVRQVDGWVDQVEIRLTSALVRVEVEFRLSLAIDAMDITFCMNVIYFSLNTQGQQGAGLKYYYWIKNDKFNYKREAFQNSWSMVIPTKSSDTENSETFQLNLRPNSGHNFNPNYSS